MLSYLFFDRLRHSSLRAGRRRHTELLILVNYGQHKNTLTFVSVWHEPCAFFVPWRKSSLAKSSARGARFFQKKKKGREKKERKKDLSCGYRRVL
jgi:hypothetical protein